MDKLVDLILVCCMDELIILVLVNCPFIPSSTFWTTVGILMVYICFDEDFPILIPFMSH